jgi:hypothetical protein
VGVGGEPRGSCVSIVSIAHALDECPNPCGDVPKSTEMSWQAVLTLLTALTMVARFSIPALILIVRVPARPSRLNDMLMPSTRRNVCARHVNAQHAKERLRTAQPASEGAGIFWPIGAIVAGKSAGGTQKI